MAGLDKIALFSLGFISLIWHSALILHADPLVFPDSRFYLHLADNLLNWKWDEWHFRTPGYPMFLAIVHLISFSSSALAVVIVQMLISFTVPLLLYSIFRVAGSKVWISICCAFVYFLDWPGQVMAVAILSESLTQFLVLALLLTVICLYRTQSVTVSIIASFFAFALIMVRPAFLPLVPAFTLFLLANAAFNGTIRNRYILKCIAIFGITPIFLTSLWCLEMKRETGKFTISHITGIALFNQVATELVDFHYPENPLLVDQLKNAIEEVGERNAAWVVVQESENAWKTADQIKSLSITLIREFPNKYLLKVWQNCREFWVESATYVYTPSKTNLWMMSTWAGRVYDGINNGLWLHPGRILRVFAGWNLLALIVICWNRAPLIQRIGTFTIVVVVYECMLGHTLFNGADLARYRMPIQTLFLSTGLFMILQVATLLKDVVYSKCRFKS